MLFRVPKVKPPLCSFCKSSDETAVLLFSREAVAQRCSVKKVFLEISQNSQENTCATVSFLIKLLPDSLF